MTIQTTVLGSSQAAKPLKPNVNVGAEVIATGSAVSQKTDKVELVSSKVVKADKKNSVTANDKGLGTLNKLSSQNDPNQLDSEQQSDKLVAEQQKAQLEKMVESLDQFISSFNKNLSFRVEEDLETTVVSVYETSSGDLVKQIPNEDMLNLARKMVELSAEKSNATLNDLGDQDQPEISGTLFTGKV